MYQDPSVVSNERQPNGSSRITFQFRGDAGEPVVTREFTVVSSTTKTTLRTWAYGVIEELNAMNAAANLADLEAGQIIRKLAPVAPVPTAKSVWWDKLQIYSQVKAAALTGAILDTDLAAMKDDLEVTYRSVFLQGS